MSAEVLRTDVIIVGAGFTGLSAADALTDAGADFVLLEARDRVGGRVESQINGLGERIDTGGQYFCDDMPEVIALSRRFGRRWVEGLHQGRGLMQPASPRSADDVSRRASAIRDRANAYRPDDPSIAKLSVMAWTDAQPDADDAKAGFLSQIEGLWCQPTERLPMWYLVSNDRRITNEMPELQYFLDGTMHALAEDLAREAGSRLHLSEPAKRLRHGPDGVAVETEHAAYRARHVIVAAPPVMAHRVVFDPPLSADLSHAFSAWNSGKVIKALTRYERAFWRDAGLSGSVFVLDPPGFYVCDASHDKDRPALVVFVGGSLAVEWTALGANAVRSAILTQLTGAFGAAAADPLDVTIRNWTGDPWSGGGYADTVLDFAATDAEAVLRAGLPRVTFASSELSPSFPGYVEGAIVAGRAGATQVIRALEKLSR